MCVIIRVPAQKVFPFEALSNAMQNNPHGVGIVYSDKNNIRVERHLLEKVDPDFVMKLLEKEAEGDRFLHLRNRTRGAIDKDNLHPFPVINDNKNAVYMMHNGTFHDVGTIQHDESDSKVFARNILAPILKRLKFPNGKIDVSDPIIDLILRKYVQGINRILLLNHGSFSMLGDWDEFKAGGDKFDVSNTQYFSRVLSHRGGASYGTQQGFQGHTGWKGYENYHKKTVKEGTEVAKAANKGTAEAKPMIDTSTPKNDNEDKDNKSWTSTTYTATKPGVTSISHVENCAKRIEAERIKGLSKLLANPDGGLFDPTDLIQIAYLEESEIARTLRLATEGDVAFFVRSLAAEYEEIVNDLENEKSKHERATKRIATLEAKLQKFETNA
jgi:hypothetical protein